MQGLACQKAPKEGWGLATSLLMDSAEMPLRSVHDRCVHECSVHGRYVHDNSARDHSMMTSVPRTSVPMTIMSNYYPMTPCP